MKWPEVLGFIIDTLVPFCEELYLYKQTQPCLELCDCIYLLEKLVALEEFFIFLIDNWE